MARLEDPWPALNPQPVSWKSQDEIDEKNVIAAKQSYLINSYARKEDDASSINIPLHCKSKQAIQDEMSSIPNVLGVPQNTYIVNIEPLADRNRLKYRSNIPPSPSLFSLLCTKRKMEQRKHRFGLLVYHLAGPERSGNELLWPKRIHPW